MLVELERDRSSTASSKNFGHAGARDRHSPIAPVDTAPQLKILHVFRAPVGGLFRHVLDLARGQIARGHQVGLLLDSTTGGANAEQALSKIAPQLALGLSRTAMPRFPGPRDFAAARHVSRRIAAIEPNVIHGHGAKGTAYARLTSAAPAIRVYTPHGGSLHYSSKPIGLLYLAIERALMARTELFLFESAFAHDTFCAKVGKPRGIVRIVRNGVAPPEFAPVTPVPNATDIVFIGELRPIKGVDTLIDAVAELRAAGRMLSVTIVGDGPNRLQFAAQAESRGLGEEVVHFVGPMPARQAFAMGRLLVAPSRAESLPYVVLEAAAAGIPLVATHIGGIPEILGPQSMRLFPPDDPTALARTITSALDDPADTQAAARQLQDRVRSEFSLDGMVEGVLAGYREALATRAGHWLTVS